MKSYVITDDIKTLVGMQLTGVEGQLIDLSHPFEEIFNQVIENDEIGILMISPKLIQKNQQRVDDVRFNRSVPLIVEILGADEYEKGKSTITETIQKAVNITV